MGRDGGRERGKSGCTIAEVLLSFHSQMKANYAVARRRGGVRRAGNGEPRWLIGVCDYTGLQLEGIRQQHTLQHSSSWRVKGAGDNADIPSTQQTSPAGDTP